MVKIKEGRKIILKCNLNSLMLLLRSITQEEINDKACNVCRLSQSSRIPDSFPSQRSKWTDVFLIACSVTFSWYRYCERGTELT